MVCVDQDPYGTSIRFMIEFGLNGVKMGFCAERRDFPSFPAQLGCQGLIVFDANGKITVGCSPSLNQIGPRAFKSVDAVLATMVEDADEDWENNDEMTRVYKDINELRNDVRLLQAGASDRASKLKRIRPKGGPKDGVTSSTTSSSNSSSSSTCLPPEERYQNRVKEQIESGPLPTDKTTSLSLVPSVGHTVMDEEHEACSSSLTRLESQQTVEALEAVIKILSDHFDHEVEMLRLTGFGLGSAIGLSPLDSHIADHENIIKYAQSELQKALAKGGKLSDECSKTLINHFVRHANDFDSRYEDFLKRKDNQVVP